MFFPVLPPKYRGLWDLRGSGAPFQHGVVEDVIGALRVVDADDHQASAVARDSESQRPVVATGVIAARR